VPTLAVTCDVDRTSPWVTVRVRGHLDADSAAVLRAAVLKCLAEEPAAVVLDLTHLTGADDAALMVLPALARAAAAWPGLPLLAHSADAALAHRMEALAVTRTVTVVPDGAAATAHLEAARGPARVRMDLTGDSGDLARARIPVRELCAGTRRAGIADVAELVVTELAANALRHAAGPRSVILSATPYHLHVAVRDRSTDLPAVRGGDDGLGGRGLRIVEALTSAWGSTPTRDGKVVWATVRAVRGGPVSP